MLETLYLRYSNEDLLGNSCLIFSSGWDDPDCWRALNDSDCIISIFEKESGIQRVQLWLSNEKPDDGNDDDDDDDVSESPDDTRAFIIENNDTGCDDGCDTLPQIRANIEHAAEEWGYRITHKSVFDYFTDTPESTILDYSESYFLFLLRRLRMTLFEEYALRETWSIFNMIEADAKAKQKTISASGRRKILFELLDEQYNKIGLHCDALFDNLVKKFIDEWKWRESKKRIK